MFFKLFSKKKKEISFIDGIKVIRSSKRHKSISLNVHKGSAVVLCPISTSENYLKSIIKKKKKWIEKKIKEQINQKKIILTNGSYFPLFGLQKKLIINLSSKSEIIKKYNEINIRCDDLDEVKKIFEIWLKEKSKKILTWRIKKISKRINIDFKTLHFKAYRSRWGCCKNGSQIFLNWKLIMLPKKVIDYVIIHELCHIKEPNHSKSFWFLVESFDKNFYECKKWLKDHGSEIILF